MDSTRIPKPSKFDPALRQVVDDILLDLPEVRAGSMFGHPAYYVGRLLIACHYGSQVGVKIPPDLAELLLRRGTASLFLPYGKKRMRGWVALSHVRAGDFRQDREVFFAAVKFARANP